MKYLWVEDFNNNDLYASELEEEWKRYYSLNNKELVIEKNLDEALEYIEKNPNGFDVILLDIFFPITKKYSDDEIIYNKYLNNIITKDFYDENKETGAGILLFLYLILKVRFPKEYIAFLSANIEEKSIPKKIMETLECIDVDNIEDISLEKEESYMSKVRRLTKKSSKYFGIDWKDIKDIENPQIYIKEIKEQCKNLNFYEDNNTSNNIKYNSAQEQFEKVGFNLSLPFGKPEIGKHKSEEFIEWIKKIETPYKCLRRYIMEMTNIVSINLENDDIIMYNKKYNNKKNELDNTIQFKELLDNIKIIPFIATENEEKHTYYRIISQITHVWESAKKPRYFLPNKDIFALCDNYKGCVLERYGYKQKVESNFLCDLKKSDCEYSKYIGKEKTCQNLSSCMNKGNFKDDSELCKNIKSCKYQYTIEDFAYNSVLKMVRNWLAHNKLEENEIDVGLAAFIFGIGMRGLFDIESLNDKDKKEEYLKWENKLIDLISKCYNENEENYKIDKNSIVNMISKSCFNFYEIADKLNDFAYSPNIGSVIHLIGGEKSNLRCHGKYILRLFAHCLFPVKIEPVFKEEDESKYEFKLKVNTDFLEKEDAIELKYFKAIYKACLV